MAIISIGNMKFYAYHGCFEEERMIGTKFLVSIWMQTDTSRAQQTDNVKDTVDYSKVYSVIKQQMAIPSHLLENVAYRILKAIKNNFSKVEKTKVKISKLNPPIGGNMDWVSVEIEG